MTESGPELGSGLLEIHRTRLLQWLRERGATLLAGVRHQRISDQGLHLVTAEGASRVLAADSIVVIAEREPDTSLQDELAGLVPHVQLIGDAHSPGMIVDAIEAGHRAAYAL